MEYTISQPLAYAILYNDYTGLSASDDKGLEVFLRTIPEGYFVPSNDNYEADWGRCEVTGQHSDCLQLFLIRN